MCADERCLFAVRKPKTRPSSGHAEAVKSGLAALERRSLRESLTLDQIVVARKNVASAMS